MRDPIHDIVQRLALIEGRITATYPPGSQNVDQKSVHQLPALFKPGKGGPILGGDPNKPAVTKGYFVGAESEEIEEEPLEETEEQLEEAKDKANEEKLLDKVKKSFADYLSSIEDKVKDSDLGDKPEARDIGKKAVAQDIVAKELDEDPTSSETTTDQPTEPIENPTYAGQGPAPVKTIAMEDGTVCEIYGDTATGFEIRRGNRRLPSRFKNIDHATMAVEMYQARRRAADESADYIDEA